MELGVSWEVLLAALPPSLQSQLQVDYDAWSDARRFPPPILADEELQLMLHYQQLDEKGLNSGAFLLLAVASVLGRAPNQSFIERWHGLREARRRQALAVSVANEPGAVRRAIEERLSRLNDLLKHFDGDSLSPLLRGLRAQQERRRGTKRPALDVPELQAADAINEEMREVALRRGLLQNELVASLEQQSSLSSSSSPADAAVALNGALLSVPAIPAAAAAAVATVATVSRTRKVLLANISQGTWNGIPVPCVNDVDDAMPPTLEFLASELYGEGVQQPSSDVLIGCECKGDCRSDRNCRCMREHPLRAQPFDSYQHTGRLTTRMWRPDTARCIYECNMMCKCSQNCRNRVVQVGPTVPIEVFKTANKGWGVRTLQQVPKGTFICTYVGEIITMDEFERRNTNYQKHAETTYLYDLVFGLQADEQRYMLDATCKGGIARFFNHSCDPNMENFQVFIDDIDIYKPKVAFFTCKDVKAMEELTFDYKIESGDKSEKCRCGAPNCRGLLL